MSKPIINRINPDKPALITTQGNISYQRMLQQIEYFASLFEGKNYSKIAIYSENRTEWIYAFYSALQNQCIAVPIDFLASPLS